jgi:hypothetical protein
MRSLEGVFIGVKVRLIEKRKVDCCKINNREATYATYQ